MKLIFPPTSNLCIELDTNSFPIATFEYVNIPLMLEVQLDALNFSVPLYKSPVILISPVISKLYSGIVLLIPTLPFVFIVNTSVFVSVVKALSIFLVLPTCLTVNAVLAGFSLDISNLSVVYTSVLRVVVEPRTVKFE